jgi:hypothetical protein
MDTVRQVPFIVSLALPEGGAQDGLFSVGTTSRGAWRSAHPNADPSTFEIIPKKNLHITLLQFFPTSDGECDKVERMFKKALESYDLIEIEVPDQSLQLFGGDRDESKKFVVCCLTGRCRSGIERSRSASLDDICRQVHGAAASTGTRCYPMGNLHTSVAKIKPGVDSEFVLPRINKTQFGFWKEAVSVRRGPCLFAPSPVPPPRISRPDSAPMTIGRPLEISRSSGSAPPQPEALTSLSPELALAEVSHSRPKSAGRPLQIARPSGRVTPQPEAIASAPGGSSALLSVSAGASMKADAAPFVPHWLRGNGTDGLSS